MEWIHIKNDIQYSKFVFGSFTNFERCWHRQKKNLFYNCMEKKKQTHQEKGEETKTTIFCKLFCCHFSFFVVFGFYPLVCQCYISTLIPLNKQKKKNTQQMLTNFNTTNRSPRALCRSFIFIFISFHFIFQFRHRISFCWSCFTSLNLLVFALWQQIYKPYRTQ